MKDFLINLFVLFLGNLGMAIAVAYWRRRALDAEVQLAEVLRQPWMGQGAPAPVLPLDRTVPTVRRVVTPLGPVQENGDPCPRPEVSPPDPYIPPRTPEEDR